MAGQTLANILSVVKDTWTDARLNKQFYDEFPFLDRLERTDKYTIGKQARVPIQTGRSGSPTVLSSAGGTLNPVSAAKVNEADYTIAYNYDRISLEFGAINQASGGATSVVEAKLLEIEDTVNAQRSDITGQFLRNGDGFLANCAANSSGQAVVNLTTEAAGGYGYWATSRGFLRTDMTVDIGTAAAPHTIAQALTIASTAPGTGGTSVPSITLTTNLGANTTTSHYVSIAQSNGVSTTNESMGLRGFFASTTNTVGGIASGSYWQPAKVDTTTTSLSIDLPLALQQAVQQQTGAGPVHVATGFKQLNNLYAQLQSQVRFAGDKVGAGGAMSTTWNGMVIDALVEMPDNEWYMYNPDDLLIVTGKYGTANWWSNLAGIDQGMIPSVGSTAFQDQIVYALGLGARRRNRGAAAIGLTA